MTEKPATRRRAGRAKPIPFTHLPPEEQKEYYELSLNGAPTEDEALLGALTGYYDTGGYVFSRYPTKLKSPNWRRYRDPDKHTFRSYNTYLAEMSSIITHGTETLLASGYLDCLDPGWQDALRYLAAWRYHEAGALKLWQVVQYMAEAEPISYCGVEECGSRLLAVHTINRYALDLAEIIPGWNDDNAMQLWTEDPVFTGAREYVEHELTIRDWCEGILTEAIIAPTMYYEPVLRFFAINGVVHGDASTPTIVGCFTALSQRRLRWAKDWLAFALLEEENKPVIGEWMQTWEPRAEAALDCLAPLYDRLPRPALKAGEEAERARGNYRAIIDELGISDLSGVKR